MRFIIIIAILFVNIIFQSSIVPFIEIYGAKPDTLMILTIGFSLLSGAPTGAMIGFIGGLLQDLMFEDAIGMYAFIYSVIGYMVGLSYKYEDLFFSRFFMPIIITAIAILAKEVAVQVFMLIQDWKMVSPFSVIVLIIKDALYSVVLLQLIFPALRVMHTKRPFRTTIKFKR